MMLGDSRIRPLFWAKVRLAPSGCWEWTASTNGGGYGQFTVASLRRIPILTHRLTWETANGPIPAEMTIDHLCLNKVCCNPSHLEVVTRAENGRRAARPFTGRCRDGHATTRTPSGKWACRECNRVYHRARRRRLASQAIPQPQDPEGGTR